MVLTKKDLAEHFEVECEARMIMLRGEAGSVVPCSRPYDKRALGVVFDVGGLRPAIRLGALETSARTAAVALAGTAFCLVDADVAPVEVGDLVTSSETPGARDESHRRREGFLRHHRKGAGALA